MRGIIYIVLLVAAIIFVCLYLQRIHTVPTQVKDALETGQIGPVNSMTQIPARVRQKMEAANRTADSTMGDAMKSVDKEPR
jgi:uncharacterized ion transporter superfamily protein YfcC